MKIQTKINTPIGTLIAITDDKYLHQLLFIDQYSNKMEYNQSESISSSIILKLKEELNDYFDGNLRKFTVPVIQNASEFERLVWNSLQEIPFGTTISYKEQAENIGNIKSFRAVANANGRNQIMIIVPCHRVIKSNGMIGGYDGGISRKQFLIEHEKAIKRNL